MHGAAEIVVAIDAIVEMFAIVTGIALRDIHCLERLTLPILNPLENLMIPNSAAKPPADGN